MRDRGLDHVNPYQSTNVRDEVTLLAGYRPPYRWDVLLNFLATRAIAGVEQVEGGCYRRTVRVCQGTAHAGRVEDLMHSERTAHKAHRSHAAHAGQDDHLGWLSVAHLPEKHSLALTVSPSLLPVLDHVLARVRFLFDLDANPQTIDERLSSLNELRPGLHISGTRVPGCFEPFEMAVRAVLGQQITVKAARTLAQRFAAALGTPIETPFEDLTTVFPEPRTISALPEPAADILGPLGIIGSRSRSIHALARALDCGALTLLPTAEPLEQMRRLGELPGFGPWTVQYVALRALGWPDAFLPTDYGIKKALEALVLGEAAEAGGDAQTGTKAGVLDPKGALALSGAWRPWRSYATIDLWNSLSVGIKQEEQSKS